LGVAVRVGVVEYRNAGIVAAIIPTYQREIENSMKTHKKSSGKYIGTVGKREIFEGLKCVLKRSFESQFGAKFMMKFNDAENNEIVWWASKEPKIEVGDTVNLKATVKKHGSYNGNIQTELQRCQVVEVGAPSLVDAEKF
jgi:hypothetical protein